MSSFFNQAKIINVYYNKGDRKPYDINGKPIAYIGEESIGANEATTIRFYLGEDLDSSTAIIVAKRANGDTRLDICEKFGTGVDSYYELTLNAWYAEFKGKMTIVFKVYNGTVTFDSSEMPTEIVSTTGRIVVSDIFNLDVAYAPDASTLVPPFETEEYEDWFFALSTKLDKSSSITVTGALPTLTGGAYDDRYFYVENEGVGKLFYIDGSTAIEVVWGVGTIQLTPSGNGDVATGLEAGKLYWSEDRGTIVGGLYDDQVVGIGDGFFWFVKVKVGEANISKGDVVQFAGNVGGQIVVKKAVFAEITAQPDLLMGVAKHNIIAGNKGYIVAIGRLDNINTSGDNFSITQPILYLSTTTPGQLTSTKPTNGFKGSIAAIGRASTGGGSNGFLLVRPNFIKGINEATDVLITSLTNKDILRWDSTSGRWENNADLTDLETNLQDYKDDIADGTIIVGRAENDKDGNEFDATYLKKTTASDTYLTQANASSTYLTQANATATYIPLSQKSIPNGVATLGSDGRVLPNQLPGSIGEVLEFDTFEDFPEIGAEEKIFIAKDTNQVYRWSGTQYVQIIGDLALGETSFTAFRGDLGKIAYDHSQIITGNPHGTTIGDIGAEPANANIQAHVTLTDGTNPHQTTFANIATKPTTLGGYGITDAISTSGGNITGNLNVSGLVGVGTTSPSGKLDVFGVSGTTPLYIQTRNNTNNSSQTLIEAITDNATYPARINIVRGADSSQTSFAFNTSNGPSAINFERVRIDSAGNVGIGETNPGGKLHINGETILSGLSNGSNTFLQIKNTTTNIALLGSESSMYGGATSSDVGLFVYGNNKLSLSTNATRRLVIDGSGDVGIGTSSPGNVKLSVQGAKGTGYVAQFFNTSTTGNVNSIVSNLRTTGNSTDSSHFVGSTADVNAWFLYGNGTTSYSSDERLKKNIQTTRDGYLEDLMKLRVVKYNWKASKDGTPKELGLIAQEVEKVFPGLIHEHNVLEVGTRKNIKHSVMEFILIKAIQELTAKVIALEKGKPLEPTESTEPVEPVVETTPEPEFEPITNFEYDENE